MPQLDFATYASQIFWLAIVFVILYLYLSKGPLPVIREVLSNRQSKISNDLKKAESLKNEAEAAAADFTTVIAEARNRAHEILGNAKAKIDAEESARNAKIEQNFAQQAKEAERRVAAMKVEATEKLIPVAAAAAATMLEKLINVKVDEKQAEVAVQEVSAQINKKA